MNKNLETRMRELAGLNCTGFLGGLDSDCSRCRGYTEGFRAALAEVRRIVEGTKEKDVPLASEFSEQTKHELINRGRRDLRTEILKEIGDE